MIFITYCDSLTLWQTYLSDPASITMEGILIFNKHLLFLLTVIVLFVGWLLFYTIYYFIEELEIVWRSVFLSETPRYKISIGEPAHKLPRFSPVTLPAEPITEKSEGEKKETADKKKSTETNKKNDPKS